MSDKNKPRTRTNVSGMVLRNVRAEDMQTPNIGKSEKKQKPGIVSKGAMEAKPDSEICEEEAEIGMPSRSKIYKGSKDKNKQGLGTPEALMQKEEEIRQVVRATIEDIDSIMGDSEQDSIIIKKPTQTTKDDAENQEIVELELPVQSIEGSSKEEGEKDNERVVHELEFTERDNAVNMLHEKIQITIANSKCSTLEKSKLLADVNNLVGLFRSQQCHTQYVRGMYRELQKSRMSERVETYADKLKKRVIDSSRSRSRKRQEGAVHVVTIVPKIEQDSEVTKSVVQSEIDPVKIKVGVKIFRKISRGGVIIGTDKEEDLEKIMEEIKDKDKLIRNYKIEKPTKRRPQVIIYGVTEKLGNEELCDKLVEHNEELKEGELKVLTKFNSRDGENIVLEMNGHAFKEAMKEKKLKLGWRRYYIREYIRPKICYQCHRIGHMAKHCGNSAICRGCGQGEHEGECLREIECVNCVYYNTKSKIKVPTNHRPTDRLCSCYCTEVERIKSRTDYG